MTTEQPDLVAIVAELRRLEASQPPPPWELEWLTEQDPLCLLEAYRNAGSAILDAIDALTAERDRWKAVLVTETARFQTTLDYQQSQCHEEQALHLLQLEDANVEVPRLVSAVEALTAERDSARAEVVRLRAALACYADQRQYQRFFQPPEARGAAPHAGWRFEDSFIERDHHGDRARAALAPAAGGERG